MKTKQFPEDFMFELTQNEVAFLRSQIVIPASLSTDYSLFAFIKQGVAMAQFPLKFPFLQSFKTK